MALIAVIGTPVLILEIWPIVFPNVGPKSPREGFVYASVTNQSDKLRVKVFNPFPPEQN